MSTIIVPIIIPQNTAPTSYRKSYLGPDGTRIDVTFATGDQSRVNSLDNAILGAGMTATQTPSSGDRTEEWMMATVGVPIGLAIVAVAIYVLLTVLAGVDWLPGTGEHFGASYDRVNELMKGVLRIALVAWPIISGLSIISLLASRKQVD